MGEREEEYDLLRSFHRIACAAERIATLGEAGLALAMHKETDGDAEKLTALTLRLKTTTDALKAAVADAPEKG